MKRIQRDEKFGVQVGNISIGADRIISILRPFAHDHNITAQVGNSWDNVHWTFESFDDIERHRSLLKTPLKVVVAGVTITIDRLETSVKSDPGSEPIAQEIANSLGKHRRATKILEPPMAPALIAAPAAVLLYFLFPDFFEPVWLVSVVYIAIAFNLMLLSFRFDKSVIKQSSGAISVKKHFPTFVISLTTAVIATLVGVWVSNSSMLSNQAVDQTSPQDAETKE